MVTYKSTTNQTVSVGRLQITQETGVELEAADRELDALVKAGSLVKEGDEVAVPVVVKPTAPAKPTEPK